MSDLNLILGDSLIELKNMSDEAFSEITVKFTFSENLAEEVRIAVSSLPPQGEMDLGSIQVSLRKEMLFPGRLMRQLVLLWGWLG